MTGGSHQWRGSIHQHGLSALCCSTLTVMHLLSLPPELRLHILHLYLEDHTNVSEIRKPSNRHLDLFRICKQLAYEAELAGFKEYVSLSHEDQIVGFNVNVSRSYASRITTADVGNDGRMVVAKSFVMQSVPASRLWMALEKMSSLKSLRVFDCYRARPADDFGARFYSCCIPVFLMTSTTVAGAIFFMRFEGSLFPATTRPPDSLRSYELYTSSPSESIIFDKIPTHNIHNLRLSGNCRLKSSTDLTDLRHLTICGVTGNYLEQHFENHFLNCIRLQSFQFARGNVLGLQLKDSFLTSVLSNCSFSLTRLVLLDCTQISSTTLWSCLSKLSYLEYLAVAFTTRRELQSNFIEALSDTVMTLKIKIIEGKYSHVFQTEEAGICDEIEASFLLREPKPAALHVWFRPEVLDLRRRERWGSIAALRRVALHYGDWNHSEIM